jgi:Flp pilus assembly pilin Flp
VLTTTVLSAVISIETAFVRLASRVVRTQQGQASAEYALVLLGAAAVALLVVSWATKTDTVGKLLDTVMGKLLGHTN